MDDIKLRLLKLLISKRVKAQGVSTYRMGIDLGISKNTASKFMKGEFSKPFLLAIEMLEYLGVSIIPRNKPNRITLAPVQVKPEAKNKRLTHLSCSDFYGVTTVEWDKAEFIVLRFKEKSVVLKDVLSYMDKI